MATVGFGTPAAEEPLESQEPTRVPAVVEKQELAAPRHQSEGVSGEITNEDRILPRLNIVGKTGDLSNNFTPGHVVLSKTHDLGKGPIDVVVVCLKKYYREATDFDDPHTENPRTFNSSEEVRAGGLAVGKPSTRAYGEEAAPEASILLWIAKPDGCSPEAADVFDVVLPSGRAGALALFTAARTNYNSVARQIITAMMQSRQVKENGLSSAQWKFSVSLETYNGKSWFQGGIRPAGAIPNEDAAYLKDFSA